MLSTWSNSHPEGLMVPRGRLRNVMGTTFKCVITSRIESFIRLNLRSEVTCATVQKIAVSKMYIIVQR